MSEAKTCPRCRQTKPVDDFDKNRNKPACYCRECERRTHRKYLRKSRSFSYVKCEYCGDEHFDVGRVVCRCGFVHGVRHE